MGLSNEKHFTMFLVFSVVLFSYIKENEHCQDLHIDLKECSRNELHIDGFDLYNEQNSLFLDDSQNNSFKLVSKD